MSAKESVCTAACARCGGGFECGAAAEGCWCAGVSLSESARATLSGRFSGCLCRACLEQFAEGQVVFDGDAEPES